jgi:hypothetical protein
MPHPSQSSGFGRIEKNSFEGIFFQYLVLYIVCFKILKITVFWRWVVFPSVDTAQV